MIKALIVAVALASGLALAACETQKYDTSGRAGAVGQPGVGGGFYSD